MELSLFNTSNADSKVFQKYADFTIVCGKYIFQVHKAVVCSQSPYFEALCSSEFKEAIERRVELKEDHPEAVRCLVEYLYKGRYEVHCTESAENELFKVIVAELVPEGSIEDGKSNYHLFPKNMDENENDECEDDFSNVTIKPDSGMYCFYMHFEVHKVANKYCFPALKRYVNGLVQNLDWSLYNRMAWREQDLVDMQMLFSAVMHYMGLIGVPAEETEDFLDYGPGGDNILLKSISSLVLLEVEEMMIMGSEGRYCEIRCPNFFKVFNKNVMAVEGLVWLYEKMLGQETGGSASNGADGET